MFIICQVRRDLSERSPSPPKVKSSRRSRDDVRRSMESLSNRSTDSQEGAPWKHTGAIPKSSSTGNIIGTMPRSSSAGNVPGMGGGHVTGGHLTGSSSQSDMSSAGSTVKAVTITKGDSKTVILEDIEVGEEMLPESLKTSPSADALPQLHEDVPETLPELHKDMPRQGSVEADRTSLGSTDTFHSVMSSSAITDPDSTQARLSGSQVKGQGQEVRGEGDGSEDQEVDSGSGTKSNMAASDLISDPFTDIYTQSAQHSDSSTSGALKSDLNSQGSALESDPVSQGGPSIHVLHLQTEAPSLDSVRQKFYTTAPIGAESGSHKKQGPPSRASLGLPLHSTGYPSVKLLNRLALENSNIKLLKRLSTPLQTLASMSGEELVNFFHNHVATIGRDGEELQVEKFSQLVGPILNTVFNKISRAI